MNAPQVGLPQKPKVLYLVRHAHAAYLPDENRPLSKQGQRDAQRMAQFLSRVAPQRVITSPTMRAIQTVAPFIQQSGLYLEIDPCLRERKLGYYTDLTFEEAVQKTWQDFDFVFPNGESNREAQARGLITLQELASSASEGILVLSTHGNLLALILNSFHPQIGFSFWQKLTMPDVYRLVIREQNQSEYTRVWTQAEPTE